jgi:hypothetical protein
MGKKTFNCTGNASAESQVLRARNNIFPYIRARFPTSPMIIFIVDKELGYSIRIDSNTELFHRFEENYNLKFKPEIKNGYR